MTAPIVEAVAEGKGAGPPDGLWHLAAFSDEIGAARPLRRVLFGEPVVFVRDGDATVRALLDRCPHRAAPLSGGRIVSGDAAGAALECPYHGWRFRLADGRCSSVPALSRAADDRVGKISVRTFFVHEANGLVWLWRGDGAARLAPPATDLDARARPKIRSVFDVEADYDEAALGLVDPAHTPVVHRQWWWREGAGRREKEKRFEPTALGFRMVPHRPSANSRIYKWIGGAPTTEIEFRLPALRLEWIRNDKTAILGLTTMTPGEAGRVRIQHVMFWDNALMTLAKPVLKRMSDSFLRQDADILSLQNENLKRARSRALYLGDADEPAKWYFQLKAAWGEAGEGFANPLGPATLRWRT